MTADMANCKGNVTTRIPRLAQKSEAKKTTRPFHSFYFYDETKKTRADQNPLSHAYTSHGMLASFPGHLYTHALPSSGATHQLHRRDNYLYLCMYSTLNIHTYIIPPNPSSMQRHPPPLPTHRPTRHFPTPLKFTCYRRAYSDATPSWHHHSPKPFRVKSFSAPGNYAHWRGGKTRKWI